MLKWKLMLTTLPIVLAMAGVKLVLDLVFQFSGLVPFSDVGVILTACVFLIGFLLAGTMSDYKESERLPAEIAATLETIEEIFALASINRPALKLPELRRSVLELTDEIKNWLLHRRDTDDVYGRCRAWAGPSRRSSGRARVLTLRARSRN